MNVPQPKLAHDRKAPAARLRARRVSEFARELMRGQRYEVKLDKGFYWATRPGWPSWGPYYTEERAQEQSDLLNRDGATPDESRTSQSH
jgi:hypothetical protein